MSDIDVRVFWFMLGAVCVGFRAVRMSLLETWSSAVYVLSYPSSAKAVDQEKQGNIP